VKQRIAIPGGACNFDLPAFHRWLSIPSQERAAHFEHWLSDLNIVNSSVAQVLELMRQSSTPRQVSAENGLYQQQLEPASQCQLIRLSLNDTLDTFPEISGGKHRFVIRFFRQPDTAARPTQVQESISFELQCCGF
jgi:cell division protein ZapD